MRGRRRGCWRPAAVSSRLGAAVAMRGWRCGARGPLPPPAVLLLPPRSRGPHGAPAAGSRLGAGGDACEAVTPPAPPGPSRRVQPPLSSRPRAAASLVGRGAECRPRSLRARPLPTGTAHRAAAARDDPPPLRARRQRRVLLSPRRGRPAAGRGRRGRGRPRTNHAPHHASVRFVKTFI